MAKLSHFDADGKAAMVDISAKDVTERTATAKGSVHMAPETLKLVAEGSVKKGDVLGVARLAGIMAAKRTPDLVPLCHPLALTSVAVELECNAQAGTVDITAEGGVNEYDVAAVVPVIEGAGGIATDWSGAPLGLASDGRIAMAGDASCHAAALKVLADRA